MNHPSLDADRMLDHLNLVTFDYSKSISESLILYLRKTICHLSSSLESRLLQMLKTIWGLSLLTTIYKISSKIEKRMLIRKENNRGQMRQNPFHRLHQLWKLHWKDLLDETQSIQRHLKRLESFFQSETKSGFVSVMDNSDQGRFKWMTAYINWRKKSDSKGVDYTGNVAQTKSHPRFGIRPCRPWTEMFWKKMPEDGKYHNFCRNPGGSQRAPFCWAKEESMVGKGDNQRKISFEFEWT